MITAIAVVGVISSGIIIILRKQIKNLIKPKEKIKKKLPAKRKRILRPQQVREGIEEGEVSIAPKKLQESEIELASEYIYTSDELSELREVESEVDVEEQKFICVVHKGSIDGNIYVCPNCKSFYCIRCANALIEKEEHCWVCEQEIMLKKPKASNFQETQQNEPTKD